MKKKIDVMDLRWGMYISELDRPWLETPFLFQGFELQTPQEMDLLKKECKYVYIDLEKGPDALPTRNRAEFESRMRAIQQEDDNLTLKVRQLADSASTMITRPAYEDQSPIEKEIVRAKEIEVEARDYTALHSIRSCILGIAIGRHLVYTKEELIDLGVGLMLHDLGMLKIPKHILDKPAGLETQEFEEMKRHVGWSVVLVNKNGGLPPLAMQAVQQHHERRDGAGYPVRLEGDKISQAGFIGSIVDVYDAVTSDRSYSGGISAEDTLKRMYEWREKDFHPQLVEEFIRCMGIFPIGSLVELSTGSIGVVISINRARRLKPKVALVLTADKTPYSHKITVDLMDQIDAHGQEVKIARVLPVGTYDIHPMDHIIQL
jgi:HD-GYP domain-containing protein (c-di-GMP phosphodiesterase class II)